MEKLKQQLIDLSIYKTNLIIRKSIIKRIIEGKLSIEDLRKTIRESNEKYKREIIRKSNEKYKK